MKATIIRLPDELHYKARVYVAVKKTNLNKLIEELLTKHLNKYEKGTQKA